MASKESAELIIKCIKFYIASLTDSGKKCPTMDAMREIVKLDDILKSLEQ